MSKISEKLVAALSDDTNNIERTINKADKIINDIDK